MRDMIEKAMQKLLAWAGAGADTGIVEVSVPDEGPIRQDISFLARTFKGCEEIQEEKNQGPLGLMSGAVGAKCRGSPLEAVVPETGSPTGVVETVGEEFPAAMDRSSHANLPSQGGGIVCPGSPTEVICVETVSEESPTAMESKGQSIGQGEGGGSNGQAANTKRYSTLPIGAEVHFKGFRELRRRLNGQKGMLQGYYQGVDKYEVHVHATDKKVEVFYVGVSNLCHHYRVELHGIQSKPELNGKIGTVSARHGDRYSVYVDHLKEKISFKISSCSFCVGAVVRVDGLQTKEYNGKIGIITEWIPKGEKYNVQFLKDDVKTIKAENVSVAMAFRDEEDKGGKVPDPAVKPSPLQPMRENRYHTPLRHSTPDRQKKEFGSGRHLHYGEASSTKKPYAEPFVEANGDAKSEEARVKTEPATDMLGPSPGHTTPATTTPAHTFVGANLPTVSSASAGSDGGVVNRGGDMPTSTSAETRIDASAHVHDSARESMGSNPDVFFDAIEGAELDYHQEDEGFVDAHSEDSGEELVEGGATAAPQLNVAEAVEEPELQEETNLQAEAVNGAVIHANAGIVVSRCLHNGHLSHRRG